MAGTSNIMLHDMFAKFISEYGTIYNEVTNKQDFRHPFGTLIRQEIPAQIKSIQGLDKSIYVVKGRNGTGRWTTVPWIAVYDKRITTSAQKGVYIVYLLNKDKKAIYLTLTQSSTEVAQDNSAIANEGRAGFTSIAGTNDSRINEKLLSTCAKIREAIGGSRFSSDGAIDSGSAVYDAGCIYYKKYTLDTLPDDEGLKSDLLAFVKLYKKYYEYFIANQNRGENMSIDHWPSGMRDTTEFPNVEVQFNVSLREHLKAFCMMDGVGWNDYSNQSSASEFEATGSRLRTYRKMYEKFGLIYKENDILRLSRLGRQIASLETDLDKQKEYILNRLRVIAVDILSRYQLRNPLEHYGLSMSCDVHPSIVIWKAMMILDKKLHPEEMNRVILRVMQMSQLDDAIETIRIARDQHGNYDSVSTEVLDEVLGAPVHTDQPSARIAPWFSFVGWGGLIIAQTVDTDGFRNLKQEAIPFIDKILQSPPHYYEAKNEEDWLAYYIGSAMDTEDTNVNAVNEVSATTLTRTPRGDQPWPLNQIFYGAPGTGKTYSTVEYAVAIIEKRVVDLSPKSADERKVLMAKYNEYMRNGRITFTTFHQSYGYEEFIQGIRPGTLAGNVQFKIIDGIFKKIADKALPDMANNYVIIIDEINRGNISRIFGELITLIEDDKRCGELNQLSITLPLGGTFTVPNNLYIIGTMNSADKSISLIDTALRRRFEFIEVVPDTQIIPDKTLRTVLEKLNDGLRKELESTDLLIGHAFFIGKTATDLCDIMNHNIIPMLYEYFYDNNRKVESQIKNAVAGLNIEVQSGSVGRLKLVKRD